MRRESSWTRWSLLANGALIALLGATSLVVEFVLPRMLAAAERAQGVGLYDPALHEDPMLVRPHHLVRTLVSLLFVFTGLAHVGAAGFYRRSATPLLTALVVVGAASLVPSSIVFAVLALFAINRSSTREP